jgi:hypothetical protein
VKLPATSAERDQLTLLAMPHRYHDSGSRVHAVPQHFPGDQVRSASLPLLHGGRDLECQHSLDGVITTAIGIYANRRRLAAAGLCVISLIAGSRTTHGKAGHWERHRRIETITDT